MFLCWQEIVPSYLATSPIISMGAELMEAQLGRGSSRHHGRPCWKKKFGYLWTCVWVLFQHVTLSHHIDTIPCGSLPVQSLGPQQSDGGMIKKRRKRRRKARPEAGGGGGGRREGSGEEFSEDEDMFTIDLSSDEEREGDGSRCVCVFEHFKLSVLTEYSHQSKKHLSIQSISSIVLYVVDH